MLSTRMLASSTSAVAQATVWRWGSAWVPSSLMRSGMASIGWNGLVVNKLAAEGGEQQWRRLPGGAGHRQQVPGDEAGEGGAHDHGAGDSGGRRPQGQRGIPQVLGHRAHGHLVGPHDDRQHQDGQGEAAADARVVLGRHHDEGVGEDADGDGGDPRHDVGHEADGWRPACRAGRSGRGTPPGRGGWPPRRPTRR